MRGAWRQETVNRADAGSGGLHGLAPPAPRFRVIRLRLSPRNMAPRLALFRIGGSICHSRQEAKKARSRPRPQAGFQRPGGGDNSKCQAATVATDVRFGEAAARHRYRPDRPLWAEMEQTAPGAHRAPLAPTPIPLAGHADRRNHAARCGHVPRTLRPRPVSASAPEAHAAPDMAEPACQVAGPHQRRLSRMTASGPMAGRSAVSSSWASLSSSSASASRSAASCASICA